MSGGFFGAHLSYRETTPTDPLISALACAYLVWSLYWVAPVGFRWWSEFRVSKISKWPLLKGLITLLLLAVLTLLYGLFGGALFHCLKAYWLRERGQGSRAR